MTRNQYEKAAIEGQNGIFNRRKFIQVGASSSLLAATSALVGGCSVDKTSQESTISAEDNGGMSVIDYGLSFISGKARGNRVRFWVESRTRILDERTCQYKDYYQCASCKGERTFAKQDLFLEDNYDFLTIFGPEDGLIFRRKAYLNPAYREWKTAADMWEGQDYQLHKPLSVQPLSTGADIHKATAEGFPLVAQTEISDKNTGLRAILEYPVKTINIRDEEPTYQVDTGPVAFPDLSRRYDRSADSLSLAFVVFNAPHFADFVVEDETPIVQDGKEVTQVHHYSRILSFPAKNRVFALNGSAT